jgi:Rps23 Pro-64 3,4-dihydroxylase Tpa1-like proline 4-hydroxylase
MMLAFSLGCIRLREWYKLPRWNLLWHPADRPGTIVTSLLPTSTSSLGATSTPCAVAYERLEGVVANAGQTYQSAQPYPHIVFPNFLVPEVAAACVEAFPKPDGDSWINYKHFNENKFGNTKRALFPESIGRVIDELNTPRFVTWLSQLTGIPDLLADPSLEGGGMHQTPRGGFLNVHADFTMHPHRPSWRRRCNLIVYLNRDWDPDWGGAIQLWDQAMTRAAVEVEPFFNRAVIFNTTSTTYHGYPQPITCPENVTRKSIALYYYTEDHERREAPRSTNYRATPTDSLARRIGIWADKQAVAAYSRVKRRLGLSDDFASRLLGWIGKRSPSDRD